MQLLADEKKGQSKQPENQMPDDNFKTKLAADVSAARDLSQDCRTMPYSVGSQIVNTVVTNVK